MGWVYIIGEMETADPPYVKIGYTSHLDPRKRISTIQSNNPRPLEILALIPAVSELTEKAIHWECYSERYHGEWFHKRGKVLEYIAEYAYNPPKVGRRWSKILPLIEH